MKSKNLIVVAGLALIVAAAAYVQTGAREGTMKLTADDHVEIRNLYAKYNHYVDTGKDEGQAYANLFTKDAVFYINLENPRVVRGEAELKALAKGAGSPPPIVKAAHHAVNVMIEPTPEGAHGSAYLIMISSPTISKTETGLSAIYNDKLVKTSDGWKFKERKLDLATPRNAAGAE